ncbi:MULTISPECIES: DUF6802 family protein [Gordonia]|uniref:DUF6802 family protein n=1 Tax=Gordonia sp. NB41Y TaxID=875808 RepID=UPI0002BE2C2F|nr:MULTISPECIES: DUF6802 family protein [Gordonia]WLP88919.1 hypothetical protein Q9K23_15040 [Gordonia sp. NB41Y]
MTDPFMSGEGADSEPLSFGGFDDPLGVESAAHVPVFPDEPLPGEMEPGGDVADHLWMHDAGRIWDLGPADVDTDADGINDSLTRNGPEGLTVYTDADRDGQVDTITRVGADGSYAAQVLDPATGRWVPTDSGRLE